MSDSLDIITVGEAMAMFVATETGPLENVEHFIKRVAGAELNVATGLARLGFNVGWVSRVGNDSHGRYVLECLKREGIDTRAVTIDDRYPTGFQLKSKAENGTDPIVEYFRKGSAASHLSVEDAGYIGFNSARHLHLSGVAAALSETSLALLNHAASLFRNQGKTISFDPNLRPVLWKSEAQMVEQLNKLAFQANWVLPGIKEGEILTGYRQPDAIADFYLDHGVQCVAIKTGADGAWFKTAQGEQGSVDACRVEQVVDTVGAGDGFAVGVISGLLDGLSIRDAVRRGNTIGAMAIQVQGDSEGLPGRAELAEREPTLCA
ncbi:sugar kinase [Atlantibacter sp.]|uniref:sugar kinase n=1 Tax=Atlantibacter sp. TaxID=1903473 RepID=UPI0028AECF4E|nr:sugar kinase [Atlantibacter sp.]